MSEIIGILNQKGGVGKTTTSANLSAALVEKGKNVLVVDTDPQGNLTTHLGINNDDENSKSVYDILKGNHKPEDVIINKNKYLHVIPSSLLLSAADLELGGVVGRELLLKRALEPLKENYDYIIIDCPPSLGLLTLNALACAEKIIVPVQSEYLALHGVRQLLDTIDQVRTVYNSKLEVGGVLICIHDARKKLARAVSDTLKDYFGNLVFNTRIRSNVSLAEAPANGMTIFEYAPKSAGAEDYMSLAEEIING